MMFYYILRCSWNLLPKLFYVLTVNNGSRKIALEENCLISPNSNANPKPNPDPDRGSIFRTPLAKYKVQIKLKASLATKQTMYAMDIATS